ncbi:MAG: tetratricopeptide repeat protein [Opitutales bacterium]
MLHRRSLKLMLPQRFTNPRGSIFFLVLALSLGPVVLRAQESVKTLQETLGSAQAALATRDYAAAVRYFELLLKNFSKEPEVAAPSFQITVTPLHAYAALMANDTETAIRLFESFMERFPDDRTRTPFVLFNLARAYEIESEPGKAIDTYRRFVALDPDRAEAALATLAAAELMFESKRDDEGFDALDTLYERQPPGVIRNKARLTALQKALDRNRTEDARRYMLESDWDVRNMQELTVLAYSALRMGQSMLEAKQYENAIACYRIVPPYQTLLELQRTRLSETKGRFEDRKQTVGLFQGGQFWTQFYNKLISRLEQQLKTLEGAEDYTPGLYLSYGQAHLLNGRAHEAWIIFETLARNNSLPEATKSEAHYRWILAAIEIGLWEDAFSIAKEFGLRFPESPLAPNALYLLATAYQEAGQYRDAVEVLDEFLVRHPTHDLTPRALFIKGYNYNLLNEPVLARTDFDAFIGKYPQHGLYKDSLFWRALTFFAERNYEATLEAFGELKNEINGHRLEPEVAYRIASTYYAKKDYETALTRIRAYLEAYPRHIRHEEARVLLGDIQMGRGELTEARTVFASIRPTAGNLFAYAVFQTGKILRAVAGAEDRGAEVRSDLLDAHIKHFSNYIDREDVPQKERISEALYWIGWTHVEKDEPEKAREVFSKALTRYGDDIEAEQVLNIIDALARVEKRLTGLARNERDAAMRKWIEEQKARALEEDRLTYYSRLNFYLESMFPPDEPTGVIFQTVEKVPIDRLDAEGLGRIASGLVERYPKIAESYLEKLEDEYPDSRHRSYAYYTRAVLKMEEGKYPEALEELVRFRAESPMHPLAIPVTLRYADCLTQTGSFELARETLEELLTMRQAKGRPHAKALLALSKNAEAAGRLERAIPYAQRVYNVYRAYPELSANAYLMSALQFDTIGDPVAAYRTLEEMLEDPRIRALPIASEAKAKRDSLYESLPPGALDEQASEEDSTQSAQAQPVALEATP